MISPLGIMEDKRLVRDAHPTKATKSERLVGQGTLSWSLFTPLIPPYDLDVNLTLFDSAAVMSSRTI